MGHSPDDPLLVDAVLAAAGQNPKRAAPAPSLSDRELEVLRLVAACGTD